MKYLSSDEAIKQVKKGDNIFVHTAAAAPQQLIQSLTKRHSELSDITIYHLHTEGEAPYVKPEYKDVFKTKAFFVGKNVRHALET